MISLLREGLTIPPNVAHGGDCLRRILSFKGLGLLYRRLLGRLKRLSGLVHRRKVALRGRYRLTGTPSETSLSPVTTSDIAIPISYRGRTAFAESSAAEPDSCDRGRSDPRPAPDKCISQ